MAKSIFKKQVGQNIASLRKIKGLNQEQLAELIGIGTASLSKIEIGQTFPKAQTAEKIAEVFGVEIEDLYRTTDQDSPESLYKALVKKINLFKNDTNKLKKLYMFAKELL